MHLPKALRWLKALAVGVPVLCGQISPAIANPDVWVTAKYLVRFNETALTEVAIEWTFDRYASDHAISVFDADDDGVFSPEEAAHVRTNALDPFAVDNYFVSVISGQTSVPIRIGTFGARIDSDHLVINFTAVPEAPLDYRTQPVSFSLHDKTFFFDFSLAKENFLLVEGPFDSSCRFRVQAGEGPLVGHARTVVLLCGS